MTKIKLEEMLLYLIQKEGKGILNFLLSDSVIRQEDHLQQVVHKHAHHRLSLDELAFLCHMSVSTFKRKFRETYNASPAKWFQRKRLEKARKELVDPFLRA